MTRADELTLKYLDGTLTDAEGAELDSLPGGSNAACPSVFALEAALRGLRTDFDLADATLARIHAAQAERTSAAVLAEIDALPPPAWRRCSRPRRWALAGCLAASAAVAVFLVLWSNPRGITPDPEPDAFATLTEVSGAVELVAPSGETVAAEPGRFLAPGHLLRTVGEDSLAVVELPDRTRVEIEADSTVRFPANPTRAAPGWRVVLTQGQLRADVPDRSAERAVVVSTRAADVHTRGGSFVVASAGPESARVEATHGTVQVTRAEAPRPVSVGVGRAVVVHPGLERVTVEQSLRVSKTPRRALSVETYPGVRDVVFAPGGREIWAAHGKQLVRWTADGGTADLPFYKSRGGEGVAAAFAPDRTALVTFRGEKDDGLVVRTLPGVEERATADTRVTEARFLAVGPGAAWVATVQPKVNPKRVTVWDGTTGRERFSRDVDEAVTCLAALPDGSALAVGVTDPGKGPHNKVVFLDPATGDRLFALPTQKRGVTTLAVSADGRTLAAGFNGLVQVWDVRSRELVRTITGFERVPVCLAFAPDGRRLAAGTPDGQVWVWNARTGHAVQRIEVGSRGVRAVCFSPDGKSVVTAASRAPVAVWDVVEAGEPEL